MISSFQYKLFLSVLIDSLYILFKIILPIEISIWNVPSVKHEGRVYRVINSEKVMKGADYIITDVDRDQFGDIVENIQWGELTIRNVSNIANIEGLNSLKFLKKLNLSNGTIELINSLEYVVNLEQLDLSNNLISKITGLSMLQNLEILNLDNNILEEIDGIDLPQNLEIFSLKRNNINIKFRDVNKLLKLKEFYK